ncbi:MAG: superoxide dismutase [Actinobacteria bacterium 13_2_20CM_2_71_6]|nr:MAG: superoxide dismutase [Actinobacteria bacterium 13_2_20CM_2_71_6]
MNRRMMISTALGAAAASLVPGGLAAASASRAGTASAGPGGAAPGGLAGDVAPGGAFPTTIALPAGFPPEGIAIGGHFGYFGSRLDGSIYRADLRTGTGAILSKGPGTPSLGVKLDARGRLFVAGGTGGNARVLDARTGTVLASYPLTVPGFVNDVILAGNAAWFTDSANPVLYKFPFGRDGALPAAATRIPLTGDLVYTTGNNANGITTTPDRRALLVVQTNTGKLFRVDPATGVARTVDLGGESLPNGDGLLRIGRILYAVQNRLNMVAVLRLNFAGTSARLVTRLTDPRFDTPTTIAAFHDRLYLPNARFAVTPTPTTPYTVVAIPRA